VGGFWCKGLVMFEGVFFLYLAIGMYLLLCLVV
jgi:hypothetical protein